MKMKKTLVIMLLMISLMGCVLNKSNRTISFITDNGDLSLLLDRKIAVNGNGFEYILNDKTKCIIVGYVGEDKDIVIPETIEGKLVTGISNQAFSKKGLISVTIPNCVTKIGNSAFSGNKLTSIVIPDTVTIIGYDAFAENEITNINIGQGVKTIRGFSKNKLTSIVIPDTVTIIGYDAFNDNLLASAIFPNSVISIGSASSFPGGFRNNKLTSITIPDSVTTIGNYAFAGNQLTSISIPNSVTEIATGAFDNNPLKSIIIPSTVKRIGANPFGNEITRVIIPANWKNIDTNFLPDDFKYFYDYYDNVAGIYIRKNGFWTLEGKPEMCLLIYKLYISYNYNSGRALLIDGKSPKIFKEVIINHQGIIIKPSKNERWYGTLVHYFLIAPGKHNITVEVSNSTISNVDTRYSDRLIIENTTSRFEHKIIETSFEAGKTYIVETRESYIRNPSKDFTFSTQR